MNTLAVVLEQAERLVVRELELSPPGADDVVVDVEWSGVSTGTERLLYTGRMPAFPGMGYPLVPGYESIGRVASASERSTVREGERVFVPGASCFVDARGLFGGAARRLVVPARRVTPIGDTLGIDAVLLALAATAHHALPADPAAVPDLIVGHGALGRLLARLAVQRGARDLTVWERDPRRHAGADGYRVVTPAEDTRRDYRAIYEVSGDAAVLETLVAHLAPRGEIVLAGFYSEKLAFAFAPAFMREARLRIAAQWQPDDLAAVRALAESGELSLAGLVTHRESAADAASAYRTAFNDPSCIKMVLDWRSCP